MSKRKLKAALIGCGFIGINRHLPSLISHPNIEVVAFVDANEQKAKEIARKYKKSHYVSLSDLLKNEKQLDLIDIATPINTHGALAIDALNNNKHVILEKPMASSIEECRQIINQSKERNLKVTVYHTMKVYPVTQKVKRWIEDGKIGKHYLTSFLTSYGELQPWLIQQGGPLWEIVPHRLYLIMYWLGRIKIKDVVVYSPVESFSSIGEIRNMEIVMETENGVADLHLLNSGFDKSPDIINIYGDKGMIQVLPLVLDAAYLCNSNDYLQWRSVFSKHIISNLNTSFQIFKRGLNYFIKRTRSFPHFLILDNFVNSILGDKPLIVPPEEGLEVIRCLKAIEERINTKRQISTSKNP